MSIDFNYDGNSFVSGVFTCAVVVGAINIYWLIAVPFLLTSIKVKGMPYASITYKSGEGWKITKGRYT